MSRDMLAELEVAKLIERKMFTERPEIRRPSNIRPCIGRIAPPLRQQRGIIDKSDG